MRKAGGGNAGASSSVSGFFLPFAIVAQAESAGSTQLSAGSATGQTGLHADVIRLFERQDCRASEEEISRVLQPIHGLTTTSRIIARLVEDYPVVIIARDPFVYRYEGSQRCLAPGIQGPETEEREAVGTPSRPIMSAAAQWLVDEAIREGCEGRGSFSQEGIRIIDLDGDARDDLILSHDAITCEGGSLGRSAFCGAQVCQNDIFMRRGALLEPAEGFLGLITAIEGGRRPIIHFYGHGGREGTARWTGRGFFIR